MPMLDLAILGALVVQALHGYELSKRLTELLGPGSSVSFGSIYPALSRLERSGMVKAVTAVAQGAMTIPMTGSLAGELAAAAASARARENNGKRKVYGITERGEERLYELALEPAGASSSQGFALRLSLAHRLDAQDRLHIFEQRRIALQALRNELARFRPADRYVSARQARDIAAVEAELSWLQDLIAAETPIPNEPVAQDRHASTIAPAFSGTKPRRLPADVETSNPNVVGEPQRRDP